MISLLFLGAAGVFTYDGLNRHQDLYGGHSEPAKSIASSEAAPLSSDDLIVQQGTAPEKRTNQANQLDLNNETHKLYMTTDSGSTWSFVPLKPEWMRSGSYLLTSGEIPLGYWMDKTYNIAPDFSWFIYSDNEKSCLLIFPRSREDMAKSSSQRMLRGFVIARRSFSLMAAVYWFILMLHQRYLRKD